MRYLFLIALALGAISCSNYGGGGSGDVSDRLRTFEELGCANGPAQGKRGLDGGECSDYSAGQRDLYVDWAQQRLAPPP